MAKASERGDQGRRPGCVLGLNLIGTPDEVCVKVAAYEEAGVDHLCGLLFVVNTVDEMRAQIAAFARHVVPAFSR